MTEDRLPVTTDGDHRQPSETILRQARETMKEARLQVLAITTAVRRLEISTILTMMTSLIMTTPMADLLTVTSGHGTICLRLDVVLPPKPRDPRHLRRR